MLTMHWTRDAQGRLTAHWVEDSGHRATSAPRPQARRTPAAARRHVPFSSLWLLLTHLLVKGGAA